MEGMSEALLQKLSILRGGPPVAADVAPSGDEGTRSSRMTPEEMMKQLTPEDIEELQKVYEEMSSRMGGGDSGSGSGTDGPERPLELPGGKTLGSEGLRDKVKGIIITPKPGFVLKCKRLGKPTGGSAAGNPAMRFANPPDYLKDKGSCKVFVNVCQSELLALPGIKKRLDESGDEVEGMNIPMSVGSPREGKDSKGEPCVIYDIIVHSNVISDSVADRTGKYKDFVCQVSIVSLEQKYGEQLDRRYTLPKLKALGDLASQQIRDLSQEPKISEVDPGAGRPSAAAKASKEKAKVAAVEAPEVELRCSIGYVVQAGEEAPLARDSALLARVKRDVNGQGGEYEIRDVAETADRRPMKEYADPLVPVAVPGGSIVALLVKCVVARKAVADVAALEVQLSPYRIALKLPQYKATLLYSPLLLLPAHSCSYVCALVDRSNIEDVELQVLCLVDGDAWSSSADPGSKAWLVSQALHDYSGEGGSVYSSSSKPSLGPTSDMGAAASSRAPPPEDVFHLRRADGPSTAALGPEDIDSVELPEDRFHSKDAASSYIISKRDEDSKSKKEKAERERAAERVSDPNVEYIDVEDFAPGGKYAPAGSQQGTGLQQGTAGSELSRAAQVLQQSVVDKDKEEGGGAVGALESSAWAELL